MLCRQTFFAQIKKLQAKGLKLISINGAGNENRTRDTQLGKLMFYR